MVFSPRFPQKEIPLHCRPPKKENIQSGTRTIPPWFPPAYVYPPLAKKKTPQNKSSLFFFYVKSFSQNFFRQKEGKPVIKPNRDL